MTGYVLIAERRAEWRSVWKKTLENTFADIVVEELNESDLGLAQKVRGKEYAVVITANRIAAGSDGVEGITEVREAGNTTPVYMVAGDEVENEARAAGATGFYSKTHFQAEDLVTIGRRYFQEKSCSLVVLVSDEEWGHKEWDREENLGGRTREGVFLIYTGPDKHLLIGMERIGERIGHVNVEMEFYDNDLFKIGKENLNKYKRKGGGSFRVEEVEGTKQLILYGESTSRGKYDSEIAKIIGEDYKRRTGVNIQLR